MQYRFAPIAAETLGAPGDEALAFFGIWDSASRLQQLSRVRSIFLCSGAAVEM